MYVASLTDDEQLKHPLQDWVKKQLYHWWIREAYQKALKYRVAKFRPDTYIIPCRTNSQKFLENIAAKDNLPTSGDLVIEEQSQWAARVMALDQKPVSLDFNPPQIFIDFLKTTTRLDAYYSISAARSSTYSCFKQSYEEARIYFTGSVAIKHGFSMPDLKPIKVPFANYQDQSDNWNQIDRQLIVYLRRSRARQRYRR